MARAPHLLEERKQAIAKLLDQDFVSQVLRQKLPQYYPDLVQITEINLRTHKKHFGTVGAVLVIEYQLKYTDQRGQKKPLGVFSSAHSDGSRKGAYQKNKYLYAGGFKTGRFRVTRPLFYLSEQYAYFYQASPGHRLVSFFRKDPRADLRPVFGLVAGWIKKLHSLDYSKSSLAWPVFTIEQMFPRPENFIADFYGESEELGKVVQRIYEGVLKLEQVREKKIKKTLIYGDNHPENVIIQGLATRHLEMIDFTDVAIGDPMADLGAFLQQFDFMAHNYISREQMNKYKITLVEDYFGQSFAELDQDHISRINLYQSWTALRSSTFLFYMKDIEKSVLNLLEDCRRYLELAQSGEKQINLF